MEEGKETIKLGISACLIGAKVRYDGGHKLDRFLADTLGAFVHFVPVCPEVEAGLGVPREPMHLEGGSGSPRLVTTRTRRDLTSLMTGWAAGRLRELDKENLSGFIFKSRSPSSGMERVTVFDKSGAMLGKGSGIFAGLFVKRFPLIPVEDEGRLHDPAIRENFIERIFALKRWRDAVGGGRSRKRLVDFHTAHKLLLLSHSTKHYRELGRLVATAKDFDVDELHSRYEELFMGALRVKATRSKNSNVLGHMLGYFRKQLSADEKQEMIEVIDRYRTGVLPLIVPVICLKHYVRKYGQPYLKGQVYLDPHPVELQLRNHV
jgi:uncharacterized protein YbgA (DUF1722 family)/uncharacterized protein YbbK (DUF523 family)